ncbi:MAG: hypothetical protein K0S67_2469 [Nitrososphaeraceae archaeon]|nr:hypothetical protein [Nitrososphaeraceae archaeon]
MTFSCYPNRYTIRKDINNILILRSILITRHLVNLHSGKKVEKKS